MKRLIFARHAKSSWNNPLLADIDRPLNNRGLRDAPVMAQHLGSLGIQPDLILASSAMRAQSTAQYYAEELLGSTSKFQLRNEMYMANETDLLEIIGNTPGDVNSLMLVGHNPVMTSLAGVLSGEYIDNIPTCGVAVIDFMVDEWRQIKHAAGKMVYFVYPKKLSAD